MTATRALIVDDEPLLRERLRAHLARLWPELQLIDDARHGAEALELFEQHAPHIVFLDIHMPGLNGIEVARAMARRAQLVFVTAYEQYALQAFEQGAIDYLVKPIDPERLADTIGRLRERVALAHSGPDQLDAVLQRLAERLPGAGRRYLQWIKASLGNSVRLIPVDQVLYLRAEDKYTQVVWPEGEALIRKSIRELADELDPLHFVQTHRSVIVNLAAVSQVVRGLNETAEVHVRGRREVLPVSRNFLHHFRQM
ncbi:LytTR family DNA-binding domain-containing protein [Massilia sp. TS11]|uniref:LytR/AlgR family response regulator transcription factor n=1 Tax=Massilia sp. TS11 TaxID=2908003 RepID=UPI001EDB7983|nr:LytTR family DNA-binding domain-containing protein [Massilia sp. TS11]MCG2584766.1 LytTR family DNA-binding domain-containing protein [Massilia sp. TS11]